MQVEVGNLIRYKHRYVGEQFVVVAVRNPQTTHQQVRCVSCKTLKKTRWSRTSTIEVLA
jgi:hypothetical protein